MSDAKPKNDTYTEIETEARREAALQVMFKTPHKPQEKLKGGRSKPAPKGAKLPDGCKAG